MEVWEGCFLSSLEEELFGLAVGGGEAGALFVWGSIVK